MADVMTTAEFGTVAYYEQHLRKFADGYESREAWPFVESLALGLVSNAVRGSTGDCCLAEVRNILDALAELKAEWAT
jgi:hypothetical protein